MNDLLDNLKREVYEELREFGQYLAMKGAASGEQRFGAPEVSFAILSLLVWSVGKYVSAYLAERAKLAAGTQKGTDLEKRLADIEKRLEGLQHDIWQAETVLQAIFDELQREQGFPHIQVTLNQLELATELQRLGLSERAARKASSRLHSVLAFRLNQLFREQDK